MALQASEILKAKLPNGQTLLKLYDREHKSDRAGVAGLFLLITKSGSKLWKLQYRINGKRTEIALGAFTATTAGEAKAALERVRKDAENIRDNKIAKGIDPVVRIDSTGVEPANTFKAVALQWHDHWSGGDDVNADTSAYILRRLEADVFPVMGSWPIEIKAANMDEYKEQAKAQTQEVVTLIKGIGERARDVAQRQLGTINQIYRYAVTHGLCTFNPVASIKPSDILKSRRTIHRASIEPRELPRLLVAIDNYDDKKLIRRLALKLMCLTFVRTSELLQAPWSEFDLDNAMWKISGERMKMNRPHYVPLSRQAVAILRKLKWLAADKPFVFPGLNTQTESGTINSNSLLVALKDIGYPKMQTGHGIRSIASTILHENGFDNAQIELQLSHAKQDKVAASYDHADYLPQRAELMQWWADYLDGELAKGLKRARTDAA
jgi:integrase